MSQNNFDSEVAIIGTGFSGMGAAIALDRCGFSDFLLLEKPTTHRHQGSGSGLHVHTHVHIGTAHRCMSQTSVLMVMVHGYWVPSSLPTEN